MNDEVIRPATFKFQHPSNRPSYARQVRYCDSYYRASHSWSRISWPVLLCYIVFSNCWYLSYFCTLCKLHASAVETKKNIYILFFQHLIAMFLVLFRTYARLSLPEIHYYLWGHFLACLRQSMSVVINVINVSCSLEWRCLLKKFK